MLSGFLSLALSCNKQSETAQVPAYIHIDAISVNANNATEGSSSSKITDARLYVNDQYTGTFQLPATIPILSEGLNTIAVGAGIKINGIAANRGDYPFYGQHTQTIDLKQSVTTTITPTLTYFPNSTFSWIEDFETVGISINKGPHGSDTVMQKITANPNVFEGGSSGVVYLTGNYFEGVSSSSFTLPTTGDAVYLEFNYKSNNPFFVGLFDAANNGIPALNINANTGWNKIYVNLTSVTQYSPLPPYRVFFSMLRESNVSQAELYLDNIKLIHF